MHPSLNHFLITRLAYAVSLGLLLSATPLGPSAIARFHGGPSLYVSTRSEDDRGSGRLSGSPAMANWLSFRGSGRVDPNLPDTSTDWRSPLAYRGSGRITEPDNA